MPKAAFKDLWTFVQQGKSWMGPVKNRCKNGDYYWVNAFVTPIKNQAGKNVEYQSVRTKLDSHVQDRSEDLYKKINKGETPWKLKFQIDQTLWIQFILFLFTLASLALTISSELSPFITLPFVLIGVFSSLLSLSWRGKYKKVLKEADDVFSNPLMSLLYSGHNDAIGTVQLALAMRKAEINAVVGRVTDVSLSVCESAATVADQNSQVAQGLNDQKQGFPSKPGHFNCGLK